MDGCPVCRTAWPSADSEIAPPNLDLAPVGAQPVRRDAVVANPWEQPGGPPPAPAPATPGADLSLPEAPSRSGWSSAPPVSAPPGLEPARPAAWPEAGTRAPAPVTGSWPPGAPDPTPGAWPPAGYLRPPAGTAQRGRLIAPRARYGVRFYDLVLTENQAVLARIPGLAPEWLGFFLGWILASGLLGWYLGSLIARGANHGRVAALRNRPVDDIARLGNAFGSVPYDTILEAKVTYALLSTRVKLRVRGRSRRVFLIWQNHHLPGVDVGGAFLAALGPRTVVRRWGLVRKALAVSPLVIISGMILLGVVTGLGGAPAPTPGVDLELDAPGMLDARVACRALDRFASSNPDGDASVEEIDAALSEFIPSMEAAAARDPGFESALTAAQRMQTIVRAPDSFGPEAGAAFRAEGLTIDDTCARVPL